MSDLPHVIDKNPSTYSIELLEEIKELHERAAPCEISPGVARIASLMLAHFQKNHAITNSPVSTTASVTASRGGVAISVGGHNMGGICVKTSGSGLARKQYPRNSIGADANLTNYVEYLCQLYVDYMSPTGLTAGELFGRLGKAIKTRFRLRKRTRNHLSAERFPDLVDFLINEKIANTPVGLKHRARGTRLCRSFEEFRFGEM